jgi:hypothetical protein
MCVCGIGSGGGLLLELGGFACGSAAVELGNAPAIAPLRVLAL